MINSDKFWLIIFALAVGTLAIRLSIIAVSKRVKISLRHKELFTFIPAAILPALVAPMVFYHQGHVSWMLNKERLVILVLATAVSYFTKSMMTTVFFGLAILFVVTQN
jgi:branched-subunit amino acid transport protein